MSAEGFPQKATERRDAIRRLCTELRREGVPDDALAPIWEFANTIVCEICQRNEAEVGPFGPDLIHSCRDCLKQLAKEETSHA